jgi:hypothetical protein
MADVVISYARKDQGRVRPIADALLALGLEVFYDLKVEIEEVPHNRIQIEIESCLAQIVCWSPDAVASEWVRREALIGFERGLLVPVKIAPCEAPSPFNTINTIDLSNWDGRGDHQQWQDLLHILSRHVGRELVQGLQTLREPMPKAETQEEVYFYQKQIEEDLQSDPDTSAQLHELLREVLQRQRTGSVRADATAFAPQKLRRGEAELVRIAIHRPEDFRGAAKAARDADRRTRFTGQLLGLGEIASGAAVGVSIEVRGADCDGTLQSQTWYGDPLDFTFVLVPDVDAKKVVVVARVFVGDAQIGNLAFSRDVTGHKSQPLPGGSQVRLKRYKRVFLSYSSADRETVFAIASAYRIAGIQHFWDRASLQSGEEWSPRIRREIDRSDLFHLCWSKSAAASAWVEIEAMHAMTRRRRKKRPDITVQMLDGPPWAKHPATLDSINFDDFVRAAFVGYARGE